MLLCAAHLCSGGCDMGPSPTDPAARPARPSVVLVTLDTTRADRIGAYGYDGAETPHLDRLSATGLRFDAAYATVPLTLPSHASILTGTYPREHGVRDNAIFRLGPEAYSIAEALRDGGWRTAAFLGADVLADRYGLSQGFQRYEAVPPAHRPGVAESERRAEEVVDSAIGWLSLLAEGEPFFLWVHLFDPHRSWVAPAPWSQPGRDPYDAEIAYCDAQIGRLLDWLDLHRAPEDRLVIVTADHGESLGEHGEVTHGLTLYQGALRVPLIVNGAGLAEGSIGPVSTPVTNAAIAPTIAKITGLGPEGLPASRLSSLPLSAEAEPAGSRPEPVHFETFAPYYSFHLHGLRALVQGRDKLILGRTRELYDLAEDANEQLDRADERPERVAELEALLRELEARHPPRHWAHTREVGEADRAMLAQLGYIEGEANGDPLDDSLPDPSEQREMLQLMSGHQDKIDAWTRSQDRVEGETPAQATARKLAGMESLLSARQDLRRAFELSPGSPLVQIRLGLLELMLDNPQSAIPLLEAGTRGRPEDPGVHLSLAGAYHGVGRREEAVERAEYAIELAPDSGLYYQALYRMLLEQERPREAMALIARLEKRLEKSEQPDAALANWAATQRRLLEAEGYGPLSP